MPLQGPVLPNVAIKAANPRTLRSTDLAIGAAACLLVLAGAALLSVGYALFVMATLLVSCAVAVGLRSWRTSLYGVMLYFPVSGLLTLALYPDTVPGVLAKDVLFIVPAYLGFIVAVATHRERLSFPGAPVAAFGLLALLAVVHVFNPHATSLLVGAIGVKIYLFYLPLVWLGYHLIREERDLWRVFAVVALGSLLPCTIGIIESLMVASGQGDTVYRLYGSAAEAATQEFVGFEVEGSVLSRIPSTFSYWVQYWMFTAVAVAAAYGWLRGSLRQSPHRWVAVACIVIAAIGGMTSGSRGAFVFIPLLLVMIALLDGLRPHRGLLVVASAVALAPAAMLVLGLSMGALYDLVREQGQNVINIFIDSVNVAVRLGIFGNGTGLDSNGAARYGTDSTSFAAIYAAFDGQWYESWWVKTCLELGMAGLLCLIAGLSQMIRASFRAHRRLEHARFRSASAVMLALIIWNLIYSFKAQYIDLDPMNVYFWLFLGILAALPRLDRNDGQLDASPTHLPVGRRA